MSSTVQKLNSRHRRMMEALVFDGKKPVQVAIEFDITESRLSILRRSPLWRAEEDALCREFREHNRTGLLRLVPRAIERTEELMESTDERVAHGVVKDVLNRIGLVGEKTIDAGSGAVIRICLED